MKKIEIAVVGILCILIGIALAGYINHSGETSEKSIQKDSDIDGWSDVQEREAQTNPFDVDTDHDGIWDPEDTDPLRPGILTDPEQKLEVGGYVEFDLASAPGWVGRKPYKVTRDDITLPKGYTPLTIKLEVPSGYACYRSYYSYEINASSTQVIDFFLKNMLHNDWNTCNAADIFEFYGIGGIHMHFLKKGDQDTYITILVTGEEKYPYSQFIIIEEHVD